MTSRRLSAVLVGLALAMGAPAAAANAQPVAPAQLGATDLALINGVKLAGLWEMPAGQMAAERGSDRRVREVGAQIATEHAELDQIVVDAANKLGVQLPAQPKANQQQWLDEMRGAATDREFDRIFVHRLRAAHGVIFPVIGAVRSGTRNDVVRQVADAANKFVLNHLTLLESTGLVKYSELPLPPDPPQANGKAAGSGILSGADARAQIGGVSPTVIWVVLLAALVAGGATTFRLFRSGR
jgi:predicted outer membrane protein